MGHREVAFTNWSDLVSAEAIEGRFSGLPYLVFNDFSRSCGCNDLPL